MIILSHFFTHENQSLQIFVRYDVSTNTVTEIKSIFLISHGKTMPVGNLMMNFFEPEINKRVDEIDWREEYRAMEQEKEIFEADRKEDNCAVITEVFTSANSHFI